MIWKLNNIKKTRSHYLINNKRMASDPNSGVSIGASLQSGGRQFSVESVKTLDSIQALRVAYESMLRQAESIQKSTDVNNYRSLSMSKSQLAQLLGSIEKLQFNQLDAVSTVHLSSGKTEAKSTRRNLNALLDELQEFVRGLYEKYTAAAEELASLTKSPAPTRSDSDSERAESECDSDDEEKEGGERSMIQH